MDQATIAGCRAKIDRAEAAFEEMASEWRAWVDTNPYTPRIDEDCDTGEYRLFYDFSVPTPPRFPVRIGEIAHHLRSALDHLVWREAIELLGREPTEQEAREITFPICRTRVEFKKSKVQRYVSPDAWTIIERHQPYDRGKPKRSKSLGLLHWINRVDKHRLLHGSSVSLARFLPLRLIAFDPDARLLAQFLNENTIGRPLKRETEVARYKFATDGPQPNMRVQRTPTLSVSYGDTPRYLRRSEVTETIREIRRIANDFARLLLP